jgi:hypothetical protein
MSDQDRNLGMTVLYFNAIPIICIFLAAALMWNGKEGWGWFIFIAIVTASIPTTKKS